MSRVDLVIAQVDDIVEVSVRIRGRARPSPVKPPACISKRVEETRANLGGR